MADSSDDDAQPGDDAARQSDSRRTGDAPGIVGGLRIDLVRFHETWMELVYPRQRDRVHAVLGKWTPDSALGWVKYRVWGAIGVLVVGLLYPLVLLGYATRYYANKLDGSAARLGFIGVLVLSLLVWGGLTVLARLRFSFEGFLAVGAAGGVATLSALLAVLFSRLGGRLTTVVFAYPFGITALFLPPVVAALYSPSLAVLIFPRSNLIAVWLLEHPLQFMGISAILTARFELVGLAYVGMWYGLAVPVGWFLGIIVTLANVVRPSGATDQAASQD